MHRCQCDARIEEMGRGAERPTDTLSRRHLPNNPNRSAPEMLSQATRSFAGGIIEALEHFGTVKNGNRNTMVCQLLEGMDEIIKAHHVMFLSDDLTLHTPQETVSIAQDS